MKKIRIAIVGVGNCASSLVQGIAYYRSQGELIECGLMHRQLGGYLASDISVVAAFDIDRRKVGADVSRAIFSKPNCTTVFCADVPDTGTVVSMGRILDGVADHMVEVTDERTFLPSDQPEPDKDEVVSILKERGAEILLNYLPVGSQKATEFYAECALEAGCGFVNNIPVFIGSDPGWVRRFEASGLPVIGDDIKSQMGATIVHRVLTDLFRKRGVDLTRTYQLNTGGNTDFLNMKNRDRLVSKKISKTEAVQSVTDERLDDDNIHIGPSDYVPWQDDNKIAFIRMEGTLFGGVPMELEMRLSVEDSPNSAGVAIDMIRCCKLALDRGLSGAIEGPSAFFCKHPMRQYPDEDARRLTEAFIRGEDRTEQLEADAAE